MDSIGAMMFVWKLRGHIISTDLFCYLDFMLSVYGGADAAMETRI